MRSLPQDAEAGGGLMVAVIQLAITLGAVLGGVLFDFSGYQLTFAASAVILLLAAQLASRTAAVNSGGHTASSPTTDFMMP